MKQFILDSVPIFSSRISAGKIIEAHGDLRPEHICLLHPPVFIDCLEFNREFRVLDVIDELSYLALECEFLGEPQFGDEILNTYSQQTHDYVTPSLINFYKSHRALLRSKLAAWHTRDHPPAQHAKWLLRAADYFTLAIRFARLIEAARSTTGKLVQ